MIQRFIAFAILLCFPLGAEGAKIKVHFLDQKNQALGEVESKLVNTQSKEEQIKKANKKGELTFDKVSAGSYEILAQKAGYLPTKSNPVQVANSDVDVNVKIVRVDYFQQIEASANAALQQQNFNEALSGYQQLLELAPNNGVIWANLARVYGMTNNWDKAREAAQKAVSLDSTLGPFAKQIDAFFYYSQGQAHLNNKEFPRAVEVLTKAVESDPSNGDIYYALALAYGHQKKYPEAIKNAEQALKIKPDDAEYQKLVKILKNNAEAEAKK
jgi:tetratricopeptide (TPR) repeat protein